MSENNLEFDPWIGGDYQRTRWLLIGDSSYKRNGTEVWYLGYRKAQSEEYARGEWRARFENNITSVIAGRPYGEVDREKVWNCFALENYVNDSLADIPPGEGRPVVTEAQFKRAA